MKRALPLLLTMAFLLALSPNRLTAFGQAPVPSDGLEDTDDDAEVSRVARLSFSAGDVSFLRAGVSEWATAIENLPLLAGDQIYTASGARAEVQLARGSYIRLAENTALTIADLSDSQSQFELTAGTAIIRVERFTSAFQRFEVDTPNSALVLKEDGLYRIEVRSDDDSEVIVRNGAAEVSTSDASFKVREGQRLLLDTGAEGRIQIAADNSLDDWDQWSNDRDSAIYRASVAVSPDYVNTYETTYDSFYGASDLSSYGTWTDVSSYGQCWVPRVGSDWAPYRSGQWLWVPRAGWTWLSSEPWGWAPYHYGRWAFASGFGWVWAPGFSRIPDRSRFRDYRWRPALVSFFNCPTSRGNYVGWYPLAPGERWRRPDRNLRGGDHSHLQYPGVGNGSVRPGDGRYGIRPPARGITVVPVEGFNRSDRLRERPSAPTSEVSDWIRRGARAGLPEITPSPATAAPAIEVSGRTNPRRVAVPPGEIIGRPVVTRNRMENPMAGSQPRERRLISPRTPELVSDSTTFKRARKEDPKLQQPAASSEQLNPEVRTWPKPRTSPSPPAAAEAPRKQRPWMPPPASDDPSRRERQKDSAPREWKPRLVEPRPSQDTSPRRRSEETNPQPAQREKQPQPQPYVQSKEPNRRQRPEPTAGQPEAKETRRAPEPRQTPRSPEAKETSRTPAPRETQRQPEAKQAQPQPQPQPKQAQPQPQPKEERRAERGEERSPQKKP